jgi:hypothetical protein
MAEIVESTTAGSSGPLGPPDRVLNPRREPALWIALIATVVQLLTSIIPGMTPLTQGLINAVVAAAAGLAVASLVNREGQVPAAIGLVQALLALLVSFGLHISDSQQGLILTVANAAAALVVRTQVQATVDEFCQPRPADAPMR